MIPSLFWQRHLFLLYIIGLFGGKPMPQIVSLGLTSSNSDSSVRNSFSSKSIFWVNIA